MSLRGEGIHIIRRMLPWAGANTHDYVQCFGEGTFKMCVTRGRGAKATSLSVCLGEGKRIIIFNVLPPEGGACGGHIDNNNVYASLEEGNTIQKNKICVPGGGVMHDIIVNVPRERQAHLFFQCTPPVG